MRFKRNMVRSAVGWAGLRDSQDGGEIIVGAEMALKSTTASDGSISSFFINVKEMPEK